MRRTLEAFAVVGSKNTKIKKCFVRDLVGANGSTCETSRRRGE